MADQQRSARPRLLRESPPWAMALAPVVAVWLLYWFTGMVYGMAFADPVTNTITTALQTNRQIERETETRSADIELTSREETEKGMLFHGTVGLRSDDGYSEHDIAIQRHRGGSDSDVHTHYQMHPKGSLDDLADSVSMYWWYD